jgi:hypothetical protein
MENEPEELGPGLRDGDEKIGAELRDFFLELLQSKNLVAYHAGRDEYINSRLEGEAARLLKSKDFADVERHILAVHASHRAKPIWVVFPPY